MSEFDGEGVARAMTSPSERGLTGEPTARGPLPVEAAPSDPSAPAHSTTLIRDLAEQVQVAIALQRRILGCPPNAVGYPLEPRWADLGWEEIDRRLENLFRAALIPVRRRVVSTTDARRDG